MKWGVPVIPQLNFLLRHLLALLQSFAKVGSLFMLCLRNRNFTVDKQGQSPHTHTRWAFFQSNAGAPQAHIWWMITCQNKQKHSLLPDDCQPEFHYYKKAHPINHDNKRQGMTKQYFPCWLPLAMRSRMVASADWKCFLYIGGLANTTV